MPHPNAALRTLRARAEQRRLAGPSQLLAEAAPEVQRLVQELEIHQVELEMQYEELLVAQTQAEISRGQYTELYDSAPVGYCTLLPTGTLHQVNHCTSQLLGQPLAQLLGRRLVLFVEPGSRARFTDFLNELWAAPGQRHSCELRINRADGQLLHVQAEGVATRGHAKYEQAAGYHLVLLDVSERRQAADLLAASEARFRASFEQSPDGMLLLENRCIISANHVVLRKLGLANRGQLLGRSLGEFWPPSQPGGLRTLDRLDQALAQALGQGWSRLELLRTGPAGELRWDELSFNPVIVDGRPLEHVMWRDITARKHTEQLLLASEAHLQHALQAAGTGTLSWNLGADTLHPDARAQQLVGLAPGAPFALLLAGVHPADVPGVQHGLAEAQRTRTAFELEYRLLRPDGSVRYVSLTGSFDYDEASSEARQLNGLVRDITARRTDEAELNYKNRLLHHLLQNSPVVFARLGPDGCFREYAGPPLRRLGLADGELVGRVAAEEFPASAGHYRQLLAGQPVSYLATIARNDHTAYLQVFGFFDAERQEGILFGTDVTEAEHLKEEATQLRLRQQQEVHAVILTTQEEERRRIAESLHNGVGQLLYATRLHLDLLPPSDTRQTSQKLLNEAIEATRNVSFELAVALLTDFGLTVALRELISRIPAGRLAIDLHLQSLDDSLPSLLQVAVYRIVQELLNNVIKHAQAQEVFVSLVREADQLHLSVEDDGRGFDTKAQSAFQGIGLAGIRTRVGLLGGALQVRSHPGQGTGFFFQLPVRPSG